MAWDNHLFIYFRTNGLGFTYLFISIWCHVNFHLFIYYRSVHHIFHLFITDRYPLGIFYLFPNGIAEWGIYLFIFEQMAWDDHLFIYFRTNGLQFIYLFIFIAPRKMAFIYLLCNGMPFA